MSTSKHPPAGQGPGPDLDFRDDLEDDPGIGASAGTTIAGEDPHIVRDDAASTQEGDVENDADATGAPTAQKKHRTNP